MTSDELKTFTRHSFQNLVDCGKWELNPPFHLGKVAYSPIYDSRVDSEQFRRLESNQHLPGFNGTLDLRAAPE